MNWSGDFLVVVGITGADAGGYGGKRRGASLQGDDWRLGIVWVQRVQRQDASATSLNREVNVVGNPGVISEHFGVSLLCWGAVEVHNLRDPNWV